jgi:uncharacterized membrane protein SpoIIM required for sporulation
MPSIIDRFYHFCISCAALSRLISQQRTLFLISLGILFASMLGSFIYTQFKPDTIYSISSEYQASTISRNFNPALDSSRISTNFATDISMFKFYVVNNVSLGLRIFIAGLLLGAGSLVLLTYQGISMGILMGYVAQLGFGKNLWPYIIGHSSFELLAAVFCAVGGLMIGRSLIKPQLPSRLKSFTSTFRHSLAYVFVASLFFVIAAIIEAFWSPNIEISSSMKYLVGSIIWLLIFYVFFNALKKHESL